MTKYKEEKHSMILQWLILKTVNTRIEKWKGQRFSDVVETTMVGSDVPGKCLKDFDLGISCLKSNEAFRFF